ncbi:hypothetical protein VNI00_019108 [Paramarasmius palmivorus]|uniref:Prolyl 4-hydroxylase alpha subunit Fe(2+) 2OG dioxygenase domain-containing protein n=1 Tax=Paramarasmius palmivorus TaxID=297713 RepID=A0AAW0ASR9_9AGAR
MKLPGISDSLKHLFAGRSTRANNYYSPYILSTDTTINARLLEALQVHDDPFGYLDSPLTTPPSSPQPSTVELPNEDSIPEANTPPRQSHRKLRSSRSRNTKRDKQKSKAARKAKRRAQKDKLLLPAGDAFAAEHHIRLEHLAHSRPLDDLIQPCQLKPSNSGYLGGNGALPAKKAYTYQEMVEKHKFRVHQHNPNATCPILHSDTRSVMAIIVPAPQNDASWADNVEQCNTTIERLRPRCRFKPAKLSASQIQDIANGVPNAEKPRRGDFNYLHHGISFGNGQTVITALLQRYTDLHLPFSNSIFAAFTVNFGPETVCYPHRDLKNLAFGWCAITALGDYDWTKGGHLVLWDQKLLIEFPPGTTILIPSAILCHSNTAIAPGESRYSFTMYSAGGLFRWVEHGFVTEKIYQGTIARARSVAAGVERWASGLALFSTLDELRDRAETALYS